MYVDNEELHNVRHFKVFMYPANYTYLNKEIQAKKVFVHKTKIIAHKQTELVK